MAIAIEGRVALVINECQRGVVEAGLSGLPALVEQVETRGILPRIAALARAFRKAGMPVMHMPIAHRTDFADVPANTLVSALARKHRRMVEGTPDVEFVPELVPDPRDMVVWRTSGIFAFSGTAVELVLRRAGISTVVLAGVSTNLGIAGCAMAASEAGYHVVIPDDCIAGSDAHVHQVIVHEQLRMIARITTAADIEVTLAARD